MTPIVSTAIAIATYATGSNGSDATAIDATVEAFDASRFRRAAQTIHDPAIATTQKSGNETTIPALIHATGLFIEPGASKNIAESAAPTNPGISSAPQTADAMMAIVGRDN